MLTAETTALSWQWRYDVRTGAYDGSTSVRVACYAVTVEDGVAYVDL